ncbi:MAG: WG repeat-containing protein [Zoogloeaceae bacterium]|jgi:hypothetical protein|nr:WG repeat-containing protein [Zoogloeaceae bacterium]
MQTFCKKRFFLALLALATSAACLAQTPRPPLALPVWVNGEVAVLDENANFLIPFENDYNGIIAGDYQNTLWVSVDDTLSVVSRDGREIIVADFPGHAAGPLLPGLLWFRGEDNKLGIANARGEVVQAALYDEFYTSRYGEYIVYELKGKSGIINRNGEVITKARYNEIDAWSGKMQGGLILAEQDKTSWVIDINARTEKKVTYREFSGAFNDGHIPVSNRKAGEMTTPLYGLADASGKLVIPLKYPRLDTPAEGLIAFKEKEDGPCGYLDFKGKVVIKPRFASCLHFGKKGALASETGTDLKGKYGLIDRAGAWVMPPKYDYAFNSICVEMPSNLACVALEKSLFFAATGIFDLDRGEEVIAPEFTNLAVLNENLLRFTPAKVTYTNIHAMGSITQEPAVGLMDWSGRVLIEAREFNILSLDDSGKVIHASSNGGFKGGLNAVFDLQGRELLRFGSADADSGAARWQSVKVAPEQSLIYLYAHARDEDGEESRTLSAVYTLTGERLFGIETTDCGAEVLKDGKGKTLWPEEVTPYCVQTEGDETEDL